MSEKLLVLMDGLNIGRDRNFRHMVVKIGFGISLSVTAYVLTQLWSKSVNRSNTERESRNSVKREQQHNVDVKKKICSYSKADSTQKNGQEEETKRVDSSSSSLNSQSLADYEKLHMQEFNDLSSEEELQFPSEKVESSQTIQYSGKKKQVSRIDSDLTISEQDRQMHEAAMAKAAAEIERLTTLVQELQKREEEHENELLQYYVLKEQETSIVELQRLLRLNGVDIEMLNLKINSLETQKRKVEEEVAEASLINKEELASAKARFEELQRQTQKESIELKKQLFMLQQNITILQDREKEASAKNFELEKKIETLKNLEVEVVELRRANKELQHEKRELMVKLDIAEAKIASLSQITESEEILKAREEANILMHENDDLSKQIEGLQNNRFTEVEELVYLKWVNACLRYELRNSKSPAGEVRAVDLKQSLSPTSREDKAKQLMLEYTDNDIESASSQKSTLSESGDFDNCSLDGTESSRKARSKRSTFIQKLKWWGKRKNRKNDSMAFPVGSARGNGGITEKKSSQHRHSISRIPLEVSRLMSGNSSVAGSMESFRSEVGYEANAWSTSTTFLEAHDAMTQFFEAHCTPDY